MSRGTHSTSIATGRVAVSGGFVRPTLELILTR